jgi:hypothetical protein
LRFSDSGNPLIKRIVGNSTKLASDATKSRVTEIAGDVELVSVANRFGNDEETTSAWTSVFTFEGFTREARIHFDRDLRFNTHHDNSWTSCCATPAAKAAS